LPLFCKSDINNFLDIFDIISAKAQGCCGEILRLYNKIYSRRDFKQYYIFEVCAS